jgi:membrane protease YdiL (CAAX protease family)
MFEKPSAQSEVWWITGLEGLLTPIAFLFAWLLEVPLWALLKPTIADLLWGLIGTAPLLLFLIVAFSMRSGPLANFVRKVSQLIGSVFHGTHWGHWLTISVFAGVGEELLFRGVLQTWLAAHLGSFWAAAILASLIFGAVHAMSLIYFALATLIGVYLSGLLWLSGSLWPPIIAHALYDVWALALFLRRKPAPADASTNIPTEPAPPQTESR